MKAKIFGITAIIGAIIFLQGISLSPCWFKCIFFGALIFCIGCFCLGTFCTEEEIIGKDKNKQN